MASYRRGYNWEQFQYYPAPVGGLNLDAPAHEVPAEQAVVLDNFFIRPGKIQLRWPIGATTDLTGHAPLSMAGAVSAAGGVLIGQRANPQTGTDPWFQPYAFDGGVPSTDALTTGLWFDSGGGSISTIALTKDQVPGPRWINFDGTLYGISYSAVAAAVNDFSGTYQMRPLNLLTLPMLQTSATAPTVLSNAPHGAIDLIGYQSRIWLLGGIDTPGAGTTFNPNDLFFTNPIAGGGGSASADWKDSVTGLTNQIVLDKDISDPGVGLAVTRAGLLIFRRRSVWILLGTSPANYTLRLVSREVGCIDPRSICTTDTGVYFMSKHGLMLTNGSTVTNVSGAMTRTLSQLGGWLDTTVYEGGTATATCCELSSGDLVISLGYWAASVLISMWSGVFERTTGAWSALTSNLWTANQGGVALKPYAGAIVPSLVGLPSICISSQNITTLDSPLLNGGRFLIRGLSANTPVALYDRDYSLVTHAIPAVWQSGLWQLVNPWHRSQAKRLVADYTMQSVTHTTTHPPWTTEFIDGSGADIIPSFSLPAGGSPVAEGHSLYVTPSPRIQRLSTDCVNELTDAAVKVSLSDATTNANIQNAVAELYGIGIEFQQTSDRRG